MKRLTGKVAFITGANSGIGRGVALCMADEGADIAVVDIQPTSQCEEVVQEISARGQRARAWRADVSERAQLAEAVKSVVKHFGRLDIAVADPAFNYREAVVEAKWELVQRSLAVTQLGVFHTCQLVARQMVHQRQGGKIIIVSSIHAKFPFARSAIYNMAKAGINQFAATLANELARDHVNVNIIEPGWIDTPGERKTRRDEDLRQGAQRIPWGRLGTPRDIGLCAVFLASEDADYITGACVRIDGGYTLGLTLPYPASDP